MPDPADAPAPPTPQPAQAPARCAGRSAPAITLFLGVMLAWLGADLVSKSLAFERVAGVPLRLTLDDHNEPVVWYPGDAPDTWVVSPPHPDHPDVAATAIPDHDNITVIPGVLDLRLTLNEGAVFGSGQGLRWLFIAISVVAVGVIGYLFVRSPARAWVFHVALAMILSGALGNLHDRFHFAAVRDMLLLFPELGLWPYIFNIADVALVVGVAIVVVYTFITDRREAKQTTAAAND